MDSIFDDWRSAFILIGLGLLCLFLEVFVPSGGILGILGVGCSGFGIYELFAHGHFALGCVSIVLVSAATFFGLRFGLRRLSLRGSLPVQNPGPPAERLEALVGKEGTAQTALRPAGVALIDARRVDVVSQGQFVEAGARVKVVGTSENRVVVRELRA